MLAPEIHSFTLFCISGCPLRGNATYYRVYGVRIYLAWIHFLFSGFRVDNSVAPLTLSLHLGFAPNFSSPNWGQLLKEY